MLEFDFLNPKLDASMFIKHYGFDTTILLVYIDDILPIGNDSACLEHMIQCLHNKFTLKVVSGFNYFLGIQIPRIENYLYLT